MDDNDHHHPEVTFGLRCPCAASSSALYNFPSHSLRSLTFESIWFAPTFTMGNCWHTTLNQFHSLLRLTREPPKILDEQRELILYYGGWTKSFCYTFFALSILNSLARADCTFGIAIVGFLSILHSHKGLAEIFLGLLVFSWFVDLAWILTHGPYLHDFGRIPRMAADSMANLMRMHKFSLAISILQLLAKTASIYPIFNFWTSLPHQLPQHVGTNSHKREE